VGVIGRTLSHYRVAEKLGAGGMGEVYRARDEKLGRDVALKVLPPGLLGQEQARSRFHKEAQALSRLSHPHIATLHDFDSEGGTDFLVMELVEGKTLVEVLNAGPLSEKEVVRLGSQLARGLQVAHEHGVIHRDLKPGNLALTADGLLKILDFGLARLEHLAQPGVGEKTASTDTAVGRVAGTPAYMAPEQLRGKGVDARTDVYGAGACLYELTTGRRPFGSRSGVELTDAVLHEAPVSPRSVSGTVSPGLEAVIVKCLDKDPGLRYQTAKELLVDLERLQAAATSGSASQPVAVVAAGRRRRWRWLTAAAAGGLLLAAGAWLLRPVPPLRIANVRPLRLDLGALSAESLPSTWATDGVRLYYVAHKQGEYQLFQVAVTGGEPSDIEIPAPLRRSLEIYGFLPRQSALLCLARAERGSNDQPVWSIPVPHGTPRRLGDLVANFASVSPDGEQIALVQMDERRLVLARADGSDARLLVQLPPRPGFVTWAPDGRRIRYQAAGPSGHEREAWIWETTVAGDAPQPLWPGYPSGWTRDGRYFVLRRSTESSKRLDVFAVREKPWPPWARAQPVPITSGPLTFDSVRARPDGGGLFAFGADTRGELLRYDPVTGHFAKHLEGASIASVDASRDGEWLAWTTWPEGVLWRSRADGSQKLRLTPTGLWAGLPRWSPDGTRIAFTGQRAPGAARSVSLVSADGGAAEVLATPEPGLDHWDVCWLPDGHSLVFSYLQRQRIGLFRVDLTTRQVSPWPGAERLQYPKCSPQGRVFALERAAPARNMLATDSRVFLPERGAWQEVTVPGFTYANWTRDGQALIGLNASEVRIERFSLATRRSEVIADVRSLTLASQANVPWMGLDATDAPLVTRDVSTSDLYALDWEAP
jgi:dipeptidyl aminopeptidase/acylaminoacyl peptidase